MWALSIYHWHRQVLISFTSFYFIRYLSMTADLICNRWALISLQPPIQDKIWDGWHRETLTLGWGSSRHPRDRIWKSECVLCFFPTTACISLLPQAILVFDATQNVKNIMLSLTPSYVEAHRLSAHIDCSMQCHNSQWALFWIEKFHLPKQSTWYETTDQTWRAQFEHRLLCNISNGMSGVSNTVTGPNVMRMAWNTFIKRNWGLELFTYVLFYLAPPGATILPHTPM